MGADWESGLEDLSDAALERLSMGRTQAGIKRVQVPGSKADEIKDRARKRNETLFKWEKGLNPNQEYDYTVRLPGYMIMLLEDKPEGYVREIIRNALGEQIDAVSERWLVAVKANVAWAKSRFTSHFG